MRKIIAAINMSLDGYCNHDAMNADDEIHEHFSNVLRSGDTMLYGRTTYQLMEDYWPSVVKEPTGNKATDEFAVLIDNIQKIVYSRTLEKVTWRNSELKHAIDAEEIQALKQSRKGGSKNILVGSPSMIVQLANLGLIDEFHPVVHPVIVGKGLPLFKNITDRIELKLVKTKSFKAGAVAMYYAR